MDQRSGLSATKPSVQEAHREFLDTLTVSKDKLTGLVTVGVEHESPDVAKKWVEFIIERVSEDLRVSDVLEAERSIQFLEEQSEKTNLVSIDEVFAQLIEDQTKKVMLARVSKNYVFEVVDPPISPEYKVKPLRAIICVSGTLLGFVLGLVTVLIRHSFRDSSLEVSRT